jgi:Concanavalin A-like lectin/glucanases superfamily
MKKQIFLIAVMFSAILFSCSKEKIETPKTSESPAPIGLPNTAGQKAIPPSLNQNLEGLFQFDGNLLEQTGKLNAQASTAGADIYTEDRKGVPNSAIKFMGRYGLITDSVPTPTNCSVAAWVKYDSPKIENWFVYGLLGFGQSYDQYVGYVSTPATTGVLSGPIDDHWHFLVTTYDGQYIRFYVDGNFVGNQFNPGTFNSGPGNPGSTFWIGGDVLGTGFWLGAMDDLRFYSRTLSDKDVTKLYNL